MPTSFLPLVLTVLSTRRLERPENHRGHPQIVQPMQFPRFEKARGLRRMSASGEPELFERDADLPVDLWEGAE